MKKNTRFEDRQKKIEEASKRLEEGIKAVFTSEKYLSWLKCASKFHRYSYRNQIMIALQRPDAAEVAGFTTWKRLERHVKKGEKGIEIFAPVLADKKDPLTGEVIINPKTNKPEKEIVNTKIVHVFDISQTDGKELPTIADPLTGTGEKYQKLKESLINISVCPVAEEIIKKSKANGYYVPSENRIVIRDTLSDEMKVKTLIHEIAHARLHNAEEIKENKKNAAQREVEAESVAYIVSNHFGIDSSAYSFGYVAGWSKDKELDELKESLSLIQSTAGELIDKVESYLYVKEQPPKEMLDTLFNREHETIKDMSDAASDFKAQLKILQEETLKDLGNNRKVEYEY